MKLTLQYHLENSISNSKNTTEFIRELNTRNISPKFNVSKSTGRVTGISFRHKGIIYKGSSLGRHYSWNNIIKRIDYEQDRDRGVILKTNSTERRIDTSSEENSNAATRHIGKKQPIPGRHIKVAEQPKFNLEKAPSEGLKLNQMDDHPWNTFNLELDNNSRFKKKKRKGKGRRR